MQSKLNFAMSEKNPNIWLAQDFFEKSNKKFPKSYKDMWLSGMIDVMEIILAPWHYNSDELEVPKYVEFITPGEVQTYREIEEGKSDQVDFVKDWMDEWMESALGGDYFTYPNDAYGKPAMDKHSIDSAYVIADGEMTMNGTVVFMYPDIEFKDGEFEVALIEISESTVSRNKSFAELVCLRFHGRVFGGNCRTKNDLLQADSRYAKIFDES